jgi:2-keto-4-pentenoate hydratase/2-oxohepta-3-ene-1,7-dioic acid hydratase in catechol pathway
MKIICIGRNYLAHAKELNNELPTEPLFFMKPDTALLKDKEDFYFPLHTNDLHHEVELVLKISKSGKHIQEKFAHKYYEEIGVGIDFTARDTQELCKQKSWPWEIAKAFDHSAPIGGFKNKSEFTDINAISFRLDVNGITKQIGNTKDLIFNFDRIISHVSKYLTLKIGDLIYTGTPSGVGAVKIGDRLTCFIENEKLLDFEIK